MRVDPDADTLVMTLPHFRLPAFAPAPRPAASTASTASTTAPAAAGATVWPVHLSKPAEPQTLSWPVPRRPWRSLWCLLSLGHFWFPGSDRCLDCGRRRRRWAG